METTFENKCYILADLWINYRHDEEFEDFVEYADLGLPLAYMLDNNLVKPINDAEKFVNETFDVLLASLDIKEDTGFDNLRDLFIMSEG